VVNGKVTGIVEGFLIGDPINAATMGTGLTRQEI
jgi:hypothetical protein